MQMVQSAGSWTDGGITSEILEDVCGRTYVITYGSDDERADRIRMIEDLQVHIQRNSHVYCADMDSKNTLGEKTDGITWKPASHVATRYA